MPSVDWRVSASWSLSDASLKNIVTKGFFPAAGVVETEGSPGTGKGSGSQVQRRGLSLESGTTASSVSREARWKMSSLLFSPAKDWQKAAMLTMHRSSREENASTCPPFLKISGKDSYIVFATRTCCSYPRGVSSVTLTVNSGRMEENCR